MDRRIFLNLLPAAGALFGLKAKGAPVPAQQTYLQWRAARERLRMSAAAIQKQRAADLAFYDGDQWPAEVRAKREMQGRPCLVFNKLPGIVAQLAAQRNLSREEHEALTLETVRSNRDRQLLYNYLMTMWAEDVAFRKRYPPAERTHGE